MTKLENLCDARPKGKKNHLKKEYDFSKGVRGKFCNAAAEFNLSIYLESEIAEFVKKTGNREKPRPKPNRQYAFAEG